MSSIKPNILSAGEPNGTGYSADVQLWLELADGQRLSLSQAGPQFVIFPEPTAPPAGRAVIEVCVDGRPHRRQVMVAPSGKPAEIIAVSDL